MPEPPKPKKGSPEDLHEVERALSVLSGRHPEHERARREDNEARRRRAAEQDTVAFHEARRIRGRRAVLVGIATPVLALFVFIAIFGRREMSRRAKIDAISESFATYGFTTVETSLRGSTGALEANVEPGCLLAVSTADKPLTISRNQVSLTAAPASLFCTCTPDHIAITSPVGAQGGIALLRADAATIGGSRAFAFAPFKPASTLVLDEPCSDASLDAWIAAKHQPVPAASDAWLDAAPARAALKDSGFQVVATGKPEWPFVVVDVPKDSCLVAVSSLDEPLAFRKPGDVVPLAEGAQAVARCAQAGSTVVVAHGGAGIVTVLVASAARVGGSMGLRELTTGAGLHLSISVLAGADRPWDAKQFLVASAIPEGAVKTASAPDVAPDADARIVALSLETMRALVSDTAPDVRSACTPPIDEKTRETLCVFSGPQKWKSPGTGEGAVGGLARTKLPFWMYSMQSAKDPVALDGMCKLLGLARVLERQGFSPTTLEALTERPNGVEVLGRTGEDAVVAVGVGPSDPWVYPLSEDAPWELDGTPQIALVKPLQKVLLVTTRKKLPPVQTRRTVVFRRKEKAAAP